MKRRKRLLNKNSEWKWKVVPRQQGSGANIIACLEASDPV